MIMENKILELLEQKGSVSMNDDIFPLVEKEFEGQVIGAELYELAHQYISQLLYGVHTAGVAVIAVPKFAAGQQFGQMVVADVIYTKVNDTPYDFMQQLRNSYGWLRFTVTVETLVNTGGYGWLRLKAIFLLFLFYCIFYTS